MDNALAIELNIISMEAAGGLASLYQAVDRMPGFITAIRQSLTSSTTDENGDPIPATYSKLARRIAGSKYMDLQTLTVHTPPGLKGTYLDYLEALEEAEKTILAIPKAVVEPFTRWVAQLTNNPELLSSQRGMAGVKDLDLPDQVKLRGQIMHGIDGANKTTDRRYGEVIKRNADWGQIENKLEALNHNLIGAGRKKIATQVSDAVDMVENLIERIREDHEEYPVSEQSVALLAKTCFNVAKVLELYAVYCYQLRLLTVAIEDSQTYLEKVLNNYKVA